MGNPIIFKRGEIKSMVKKPTSLVMRMGLAAIFTAVLAGCSSTASDEPVEVTDSLSPAPAPVVAQPSAAEVAEQRRREAMLATTTFYFDFDRSDLKPEAREALVYHAEQLSANPSMRIRLEGHADERGTTEYNLALGERRAKAVESYLQVQGVTPGQMEVISYGESRPVDTATTEAAYARNRRVELVR